jgi:hypothetical protein
MDGIPAQVFKHGGAKVTKKLLKLFELIWEIEK